jgi:hypothetical protein
LHSKLDPLSLEAKAKLAEVLLVEAGGPPPIEVSGGVVSGGGGGGGGSSTVQDLTAGVRSTFPAASRARTRNQWVLGCSDE